jgi:hypothetical protein
LALLRGLRNSRAFPPVHNGEGEEAEGAEEERIPDPRINKTMVEDTEDGAGVIRKVGGADEVKEKVEAVAEGMLQRKAKHL